MYAEWERKTPNFSNKIEELLPIVYSSHHFWAENIKAKPKTERQSKMILPASLWSCGIIRNTWNRNAIDETDIVWFAFRLYTYQALCGPFCVHAPQWPAKQTHINREKKNHFFASNRRNIVWRRWQQQSAWVRGESGMGSVRGSMTSQLKRRFVCTRALCKSKSLQTSAALLCAK